MIGRYSLALGLLLFPANISADAEPPKSAEVPITREIENAEGQLYITIFPDGKRNVSVNYYVHPEDSGLIKRALLDEGGEGIYDFGWEARFECDGRSLYFTVDMDRSTPRGIEYLDSIATEANEARIRILEQSVVEEILEQN